MEEEQTTTRQESAHEEEVHDIDMQAIVAGMSYMSILVFIPILLPGTNEFVSYHLRQGIILFLVGVVTSLLAWVWLPLWVGLNGIVAVISIYGFVQAAQGKRWVLPILGRYARKLKL